MKILVVGSIPNNFPKAAAKINAINLKHGPFEFCLITGTLNIDTDAKLDLTTYSLGDHKNLDNLVSLGDNGILKTANGTTIAYHLHSENYEFDETKVDILLTKDWPLGILNNTKDNFKVEGSQFVSEVSTILTPRYHFCSKDTEFYEREPYKNHNGTFTRFISLGSYGNQMKHRWFYAMNLGPRKPETKFTESPFLNLKRKSTDDGFFYNEQSNRTIMVKKDCKLCKKQPCPHNTKKQVPDGYLCRICAIPGHHIYDCPQGKTAKKPRRQKCWFCLSNPDIESHMIVTVLDDCYVALAKGGLNNAHLLVVPVNQLIDCACSQYQAIGTSGSQTGPKNI